MLHSLVKMLFTGLEGTTFLCLLSWSIIQMMTSFHDFPEQWLKQGTLSLRVLDRDGHHLHEEPSANEQFGAWLPHNRIPKHLLWMTLAAEDHRIQQHSGVDLWAVMRSLVTNTLGVRKRSGASTLAMQLVRLLRPAPRTYRNKVIEMYWALVLQHHLKREGILREYLNRAPYGNRVQGVQRAALLYFDRPAADLSAGQAALIAALPWGPGYLNPFHSRGYLRAKKRARWILQRAYKLGYLDRNQYKEALADPTPIRPRPTRCKDTIHFTQLIAQAWKEKQKESHKQQKTNTRNTKPTLDHRTTEVRTTLDQTLQKSIISTMQKHLRTLPKSTTASLIVLNHHNGEILAYVGSPNYFGREERGAIDYTRVPRAPGSTLKPFIYAQSIQKLGYTGATLLQDLAQSFVWKQGIYQPNNYDSRFLGPIRLRQALGNSRNIPVLHVLAKVGIHNAMKYLQSIGISKFNHNSEHYGLGLALGNAEISLFELVQAYATLARNGKRVKVKWIRSMVDSLGRIIKQPALSEISMKSEMHPTSAQLIKNILSDPIARYPAFKRHGHLEFPFPVAVKTGTSQGHRDAWLMAISDRLVVGCWVGNHDRRKMGNVYGSLGCGRIVQKAMKLAMKRVKAPQKPTEFEPPQNWTKKNICPLSGNLVGTACPGKMEEWFPSNQAKQLTSCPYHQHRRIDRRNGLLAGEQCPKAQTIIKMFVQLPSVYASWAYAVGLPTPPKQLSPLCGTRRKERSHRLKIRHPVHHSRYVIDPTIPSEYATISLRVESLGMPKKVIWYVDGKELKRVEWPYEARWKLKHGRHVFVAESSDRNIRSKSVVVFVR